MYVSDSGIATVTVKRIIDPNNPHNAALFTALARQCIKALGGVSAMRLDLDDLDEDQSSTIMRRVYWQAALICMTGMAHRRIAVLLPAALVAMAASPMCTQPMKTNAPDLPIHTAAGERMLRFDFPAFRIGIGEYPDGPTGATVLHFPSGAAMAMDIRGGSPGVVGDYGFVHAIVLSGGSLLGLEAASGVAGELFRRSGASSWDNIPLVSGGIVFDFGGRDNGIYPDVRLGAAALDNAKPGEFPLGARGAGIAVTVGNGFAFDRGEPAGQGAAYREVGGVKFFACTVLNAIGAIYDRNGDIVLGHRDAETGERTSFAEDLERRVEAASKSDTAGPSRNTTLTVVVTNQTVRGHDLTQLGRQVHSSMARAIQPFHTRDDGDVLWMVSTAEVEVPQWSVTALGVAAAEVVWDAILTAYP